MKIIHVIYPVIGIMLVLMLCITPVTAVSGTDFGIVIDESGYISKYIYGNMNNPDEEYTKIRAIGTVWENSLVTFQPVGIKGAPVMVVDTSYKNADIYLPRSVDEWEIKYYSRFWYKPTLEGKYLTHKGVVDFNYRFGKYLKDGLYLEPRDGGISIYANPQQSPCWSIPSV